MRTEMDLGHVQQSFDMQNIVLRCAREIAQVLFLFWYFLEQNRAV